jgi:hypothetical protein
MAVVSARILEYETMEMIFRVQFFNPYKEEVKKIKHFWEEKFLGVTVLEDNKSQNLVPDKPDLETLQLSKKIEMELQNLPGLILKCSLTRTIVRDRTTRNAQETATHSPIELLITEEAVQKLSGFDSKAIKEFVKLANYLIESKKIKEILPMQQFQLFVGIAQEIWSKISGVEDISQEKKFISLIHLILKQLNQN